MQPPIDTANIQEPNIPVPDNNAVKEENFLTQKRVKRQNDMESTVHAVMIGGIIIFGILLLGIMFCRGLHLILPKEQRWLNDEQLAKIDEFFVHGTIGALIVTGIKIILQKANWNTDK